MQRSELDKDIRLYLTIYEDQTFRQKLTLVDQVCVIFIMDSLHSAIQMYCSYNKFMLENLSKD